MNSKSTSRIKDLFGQFVKLTACLMPLVCLCEDSGLPSETQIIEEGLSVLRTVNVEKRRGVNAESVGRWVCDKIVASTNAVDRVNFQKAFCNAILGMDFDRGDWHKTESSLDRFLSLTYIGFHSFGRCEEDPMHACSFLLTALVRARCEIMVLEQQVAREIVAQNAQDKEILAWQRKCTKLGIPFKHGSLTRSGARPTAHGAQSKYEQTVSTCIDGELLKLTCRGLPLEQQRALLENIRFAIGRYPQWHIETSGNGAKSKPALPR